MALVKKAELTKLLSQLVAVDTTSTRSNRSFVDLLEPRLVQAGFACRRHVYRDDAGTEKVNLLAQKGAGRPELVLVGHTDCVPFDAAWREALSLTERDGKLYGRGACDTKAFIACALTAATAAQGLGKTLGLVFTADEELGCIGAKKLVEQNDGGARFAIVGEPTSLTPIRANKGYCLAEVEVLGKEGHSAYPDTGASAIFRAGRFLARFEARARELRSDVHLSFEPPYTTVNVGLISGGKAKNVIPGACRFTVEWRPIPNQPVETVQRLLEQLCRELSAEEPGFEARVNASRLDRGVDTSADSEVVRYLVEQSGKPAGTISFGTEAPQLTQLGAEAVVFGPGDIKVAHQTGEFVPVDELVRCEELLGRAVSRFCGAS